eukprot:2234729-Rhodomonas_salina.1
MKGSLAHGGASYGNKVATTTDPWIAEIVDFLPTISIVVTSSGKGGLYTASLTAPDVANELSVRVQLRGVHSSGSPFTLLIVDTAGPPDAVSSDVTSPTILQAGDRATFSVQIRDFRSIPAKSGGASVFFSLDNAPYVPAVDTNTGIYTKDFVLKTVGTYTVGVWLLDSGSYLRIDDSPYNITITPSTPNAMFCQAEMTAVVTAGIAAAFSLLSFDTFGNPVAYDFGQQPHSFDALLSGPSQPSVTWDYLSPRHLGRYMATTSGDYLLAIGLSATGRTLLSSPFAVQVLAADPSPTASRVVGLSQLSMQAGQTSSFSVSMRDEFGNPSLSNEGSSGRRASVRATSGFVTVNVFRVCGVECRETLPVIFVTVGSDLVSSFDIILAGDYLLAIELAGTPLPGTPYGAIAAPGGFDLEKTLTNASAEQYNILQTGTNGIIIATAYDSYGNQLITGGLNYAVQVIDQPPASGTISTSSKDNVDGTYTLTFMPDAVGPYELQVVESGTEIGSQGLLQFYVIPAQANAARSVISPSTTSSKRAGQQTVFSIAAHDSSGLPKPDATAYARGWEALDTFVVQVLESGNQVFTTTGCVFDDASFAYRCGYTVTKSGVFSVSVICQTCTAPNAHVQGSPYSITVSPGAIVAETSTFTATTTAIAGISALFKIQSRDAYSNPGLYNPFLTQKASFTIAVEDSEKVKYACTVAAGCVKNNLDGTFLASALLTKSGTYSALLQLGNNAIARSPFVFNVGASSVDPEACSLYEKVANVLSAPRTTFTAGVSRNFAVQVRDRFENLAGNAATPSLIL